MTPFLPIKKIRVAEHVADAVREAIVRGTFAPGDALPPERDLALRFGVNRSSVREALHRLDAWGLVEMRQGEGTRVTDFLATAGLHVLPWLLAPGGALDPALLRDLLALRVALLGFAAEQAATHASDDAIARLDAALCRLEAADHLDAVQDADFAFFEAVVEATGNRVLNLLVNAIGRVYREHRALFGALFTLPLDPSLHRRAVTAIRNRQPAAARRALESYGRRALDACPAPDPVTP